jgi:hypothetical protein
MPLRAHVLCRTSVANVTPELLQGGIASRLEAMVAKFAPRDDESPRQLLARLRIEKADTFAFGIWRIVYGADGQAYVPVERFVPRSFEADRRDFFDELKKWLEHAKEAPVAESLRGRVTQATECVVLEFDETTMSWPIAMAAAAALALAGDGIVRVEGEHYESWWLEPEGKGLKGVLGGAG